MSTDIEQHSRPTSGYKTFTTAVVCTSCALRDKLSYKPRIRPPKRSKSSEIQDIEKFLLFFSKAFVDITLHFGLHFSFKCLE